MSQTRADQFRTGGGRALLPRRRRGRSIFGSVWRSPRGSQALWICGLVALFGGLAYRFCAAYFPLSDSVIGGPGDLEPYAALDWIVAKTLAQYGELPLWNPYVHNGLPFIGDPYISFFNPAVVLPFLAWGPENGSKMAVVVTVALSGIGQYWLSRVLGQGQVISLVAGVVGMTAGSLVSRVAGGFAFGMALQHGWIALTLASYLAMLRAPRPATVALAALCYTLMFHAGNLYYWVVTSAVLVLFTAAYAVTLRALPDQATSAEPPRRPAARAGRPPRLQLERRVLYGAGGTAGLAFLLDAVVALPILVMRQVAEKPGDPNFQFTQPPVATLLNLVVADRQFWERGLFGASDLGWTALYAYVGASLFVFALFLVPAFLRRPGRALPALLAGFILGVAWASARYSFMWPIWRRWEVMQQLRYWSVAIAVATVLVIPLALAGADYLWRALDEARDRLDSWGPRLTRRLSLLRAALWALLLALLWNTAADPWRVNQKLWNTPPYDAGADAVFAWLRAHDPAAYTVVTPDNLVPSYASVPHVKYEMQLQNSSWLFTLRPRPTPGAPDGGLFVATPTYYATRRGVAPPPGAALLQALNSGAVYVAKSGLPFAFVGNPRALPYGGAGADALQRGTIAAASARFLGPNQIEVTVPESAPAPLSTLVVMQGWVDGWQAYLADGRAVAAEPNGGYLSVPGVRPGERVVLRFLPLSFIAGGALSALGLLATAALLWRDLRGGRARRRGRRGRDHGSHYQPAA